MSFEAAYSADLVDWEDEIIESLDWWAVVSVAEGRPRLMGVGFIWVGVFYSFSASAIEGGWRPSVVFSKGEADGWVHAFDVEFSAVIPIDGCDGGEELSRYSEALVIWQHDHPMNPYAIDYSFSEKG